MWFRFDTRFGLEGEFLHEQVDVLIDFESVQVVGISLQSHQKTTERHVGCPENRKLNMFTVLQTLHSRWNRRTVDLQMLVVIPFWKMSSHLLIKIKLQTYRFKILLTISDNSCYAIVTGCVLQTVQELVAEAWVEVCMKRGRNKVEDGWTVVQQRTEV
jgi:hypothetical protein